MGFPTHVRVFDHRIESPPCRSRDSRKIHAHASVQAPRNDADLVLLHRSSPAIRHIDWVADHAIQVFIDPGVIHSHTGEFAELVSHDVEMLFVAKQNYRGHFKLLPHVRGVTDGDDTARSLHREIEGVLADHPDVRETHFRLDRAVMGGRSQLVLLHPVTRDGVEDLGQLG
jgi:hypothetical protein